MSQTVTPAAFTWREAQAGARALSPRSNPLRMLAGVVMIADAATVLAASAIAYGLRHGSVAIPLEIASTTLLALLLTLNTLHFAGAYRQDVTSTVAQQIGRAFRGWSVTFVMLLSLAYVTKLSEDFSRAWAIGWYVLALLGFAVVRTAAVAQLHRWQKLGKLAHTVAVVDLSGNGEIMARRLLIAARGQVRLVGVFSPRAAEGKRNGLADLLALSRLFRIDEVVVSVAPGQIDETDAVLRRLGTVPTNVHVCPELPPMSLAPRGAGVLHGLPVLTMYQRPMVGWARVVKRAEDIIIASLALLFIAPLLLLLALLIKCESPGPVLFRQRRLGFNNNVIIVLKLRSMKHQPGPETDVPQARRHDPRVTRLGRFLRSSSLDELPQLINVLRGDMSLVGPRPHALAHNEQYASLIDDYLGRHRVQPGITGWAQINGLRGETKTLDKMQRRVEHDLAYIDGWSLALDAKILFLTIFRGLFSTNAY